MHIPVAIRHATTVCGKQSQLHTCCMASNAIRATRDKCCIRSHQLLNSSAPVTHLGGNMGLPALLPAQPTFSYASCMYIYSSKRALQVTPHMHLFQVL